MIKLKNRNQLKAISGDKNKFDIFSVKNIQVHVLISIDANAQFNNNIAFIINNRICNYLSNNPKLFYSFGQDFKLRSLLYMSRTITMQGFMLAAITDAEKTKL